MHAHGMIQATQKVACLTQESESICVQTIQHCLKVGGKHADPEHVQILQDCADICETVARFAARRTPYKDEAACLCADICEACAESCEMFPADPQMKACANQCLLCADACRDLVHAAKSLGTEAARASRASRRRGLRGEHHSE